MLIIPAIDLKNGACVRLRQGRMEDATVYSDDPVATATRWIEAGAKRLHIVDLDGAFAGKPENKEAVVRILAEYPNLPIQLGGGVRDLATIEAYLDLGLSWVIIGTQAVKDPVLVTEACHQFPGQIIVGVDAKDGWVVTEGWVEASTMSAVDVVNRFADAGVASIVYTDIGRDGMLSGVNVKATASLASETGFPVIASGGLKGLSDVTELLAVESGGVVGAITGRAIYEGTLNLAEAIRLTETD
ncbi:MAG: 1-(5-phosphoribosyl)-5-[(5-phosphoribosylamino)methylideneamino]imidazole-4-carboxamide isomerase [Gammaproteobacteria bacterium]|nr:1-(5-phosphoribosyl)-5-[(5-phosphoribosylamino)methylideneamino]imidazole-4-carboxamide isomerase [Gammaproteobacteria bacterium]|tara:strand:- start:7351 stop:8082 length:732 start_codon:yes stop_codon:yes gene_type:complete